MRYIILTTLSIAFMFCALSNQFLGSDPNITIIFLWFTIVTNSLKGYIKQPTEAIEKLTKTK